MLDCQMQITFTVRKTKYKEEGPWWGLHELSHPIPGHVQSEM